MARDDKIILGEAYMIEGQRFEPKDDNAFDEVGYSSVVAPEKVGSTTLIGEVITPTSFTGAHRILPVPSYAEVTHLETGKTILVRINDRGPAVKDRTIALSNAAAEALGISSSASSPVRVRRVNPPMPERIALRSGRSAADRLDTPPALLSALKRRLVESDIPKPVSVVMTPPGPRPVNPLAPKPVPVIAAVTAPAKAVKPAPAPKSSGATGTRYIQIAALSHEGRAQALASKVGGSVQQAGTIWRVRMGPYDGDGAARVALPDMIRKGYPDARITR